MVLATGFDWGGKDDGKGGTSLVQFLYIYKEIRSERQGKIEDMLQSYEF